MNSEEEIKDFIADYLGVDVSALNTETLVEDDLGATGDDAWELIEALAKQFSIDLQALDFILHFAPEAGSIKNLEYGFYPVNIGHIIEVCKSGHWMLPPKNEEHYIALKKSIFKTKLIYIGVFVIFTVFVLSVATNECA